MRIATLSAIFGLAVASPAAFANVPGTLGSPTSPAVPGAPSASRNTPDPNELICHDRIATGSRLAYARDCHTRAEWAIITRSSRDFLNTIERNQLTSNNPPRAGGH